MSEFFPGPSRMLVLLLIAVTISAPCSRRQNVKSPTPNNLARVPLNADTARRNTSEIRSIDFSNFTYPWSVGLGDPTKSFVLRNGHYEGSRQLDEVPMHLLGVVYGDVTGDEVEDALVAIGVVVEGGSASPYVIYIYTAKDGKPKRLWVFPTGDRTHGGLRRVYSENGVLVVELYGRGKIIGTDLFADDGSAAITPFPNYYTRVHYKWSGSKFQRIGPAETLSDPDRYGIPIMPPFPSG